MHDQLTERSEFVPKLYKKGWFWALVGAAVLGTGTALYLSLRPGATLAEPGATTPTFPRGLTGR